MDPVGSISGLISGIDFRDLVDQIIAIEGRGIEAANRQITQNETRLQALTEYRTLLSSLMDVSTKFRDGTAFQSVSSSVSTPGGANTTPLVGAAPSLGASPGTYQIEVLQLAQAEKVGGQQFTTNSEALGIAGEFFINGQRIEIGANDSLFGIRDKINDANSGSDATKVTASVLSVGTDAHRLVLTSDNTGASGISLVDGTDDVLRSLGYLDANTTVKRLSGNVAESDRFSSSTDTVATMLGLTGTYGPTDVTIDGQTVSIDLSTQSLTDIASAISGATGLTVTVEEDGNDFYLSIAGTTQYVDAGRTLELLGLMTAGRSNVAQSVTGAALTDNLTNPATTGTLLVNLSGGVTAGDTFTIAGTQGDGTAVDLTYTVGATDTVQDLLNFLNNGTDGFGSGARVATASLTANGEIQITDSEGGESSLALSIIANNEGGGTLDFGSFGISELGRNREIVSGEDSSFKIDGVTITRSSNSVTDVLPDVTLSLNRAEIGTVATIRLERNVAEAESIIGEFVETYNAVVDFIDTTTTFDPDAEVQPMFVGDTTIRATKTRLSRTLISTVFGVDTSFAQLSFAGISLTRDGHIELDAAALNTAFTERYNDLLALFSEQGTTDDTNVRFVGSGGTAQPGSYAVEIATAAAQATVLGTGFSGTYVDDGTADTLTFTDTSSGAEANVLVSNGMTTGQIVQAINTEFNAAKAHSIATASTLYSDALGTTPITEATTFDSLFSAGLIAANVTAGDTINIIGTRGGGSQFESTFTVTDPATATIGDLVTKIQQDMGSGSTVSVQNGQIVVTSTTTGSSSMAMVLTANNEGGGTLDFGGTNVLVKGRLAMGLEASAVGNEIQVNHGAYGANQGFDVALQGGGVDGTVQLGLTAGTYTGVDVSGTIGGYAATGTGRMLVGDEGTDIEGLQIEFLGTTIGSFGNVALTVGTGAALERTLDEMLETETGLLAVKEGGIERRNESLERRATRLEDRLELRRQVLLQQFFRMEELVARFESQQAMLGSFVSNSLGSTR